MQADHARIVLMRQAVTKNPRASKRLGVQDTTECVTLRKLRRRHMHADVAPADPLWLALRASSCSCSARTLRW